VKILVLNPPFKTAYGKFSRTSRSPAITRGGTIYYPFWLAYCVGVLEKNGFNVRFIDAAAERIEINEVFQRLGKFEPELVVVDTSTPSIYSDVKVGEEIKDKFPKVYIVLVGTHPSALPAETLSLSEKIDAVAVREYDYTIRDLAIALQEGKDLSKVDGLVFRKKNGEIVKNKLRDLIENLDELPFISAVYKKHLNIKNYFFAASDYPFVMIITGRGCPYRCFFCVYPQTFHSRRYRLRSAENVAAEFEYIVKNIPEVREIGIEDDTFTANRERTREICRLLIKKGIKIKWYCNVRVSLDSETMELMKEAGCHLMTVGFESADQNVLDQMHKGITVDQIKQFVAGAKKNKILVHGCFMIGDPGETKETIEKTLKLAKELNTDSMQFYPLIPYPGTEAYEWAKKSGYLVSENFEDWNDSEGGHNCVISLPNLSAKEIVDFCNRATREYYLRPTYLWMKSKQMIFHPREIKRTLLSAKTFFRHLK